MSLKFAPVREEVLELSLPCQTKLVSAALNLLVPALCGCDTLNLRVASEPSGASIVIDGAIVPSPTPTTVQMGWWEAPDGDVEIRCVGDGSSSSARIAFARYFAALHVLEPRSIDGGVWLQLSNPDQFFCALPRDDEFLVSTCGSVDEPNQWTPQGESIAMGIGGRSNKYSVARCRTPEVEICGDGWVCRIESAQRVAIVLQASNSEQSAVTFCSGPGAIIERPVGDEKPGIGGTESGGTQEWITFGSSCSAEWRTARGEVSIVIRRDERRSAIKLSVTADGR